MESREEKVKGRQHINVAEILNQKGEVLARSRGLFIAIDPHKMFGKVVERSWIVGRVPRPSKPSIT